MKKKILFVSLLVYISVCLNAQFSNFNNYVTRVWTSVDGLPGNVVSDIMQSQDGYLYLGTYESLIKFDGFEFIATNKYTDPKLSFISARCVFEDSRNGMWIGSNGEGVQRITKYHTLEHISTENGLPSNSVRCFAEDRYKNIWVGTSAGLVYINSEDQVVHPKFENGEDVAHIIIESLYIDTANRIWMITNEVNGIYIYTDAAFHHVKELDFLGEYVPTCITQDKNGNYWIALINCYSKPAMVVYKDGKIQSWTTEDGLPGNKTRVSIQAQNGDYYVGTTTGLATISPDNQIYSYTLKDGLECEYIMWIYEDDDGIIWVGTDGDGVYLIKDKKIFRKLNVDNGLAGNIIFKIHKDENGFYWICTGSGISRYSGTAEDIFDTTKPMKFFNYNSSHGLGTDSEFQMMIDHNNNVWLVSNRGIASVDYTSMLEIAEGKKSHLDCKFYNLNDGLKSNGTNSTSLSMIDKHGCVWFTMSDGFAVYDPVRNKASNVLPISQIVQVQVDDVVYNDLANTSIIIPPDARHINIKYTGLSYTSSERTRFQYKLDGFDEIYSELTASRVASFTKLKPGRYTFYVGFQNADGLYSEMFASVKLVQKAYFYEHVWFWLIVAGLIIIIIAIVFIVVIRTDKKRQIQLETKIQMATVELQMAKDESDRLLQNIIPASIAQRLKAKGMGDYGTIADSFDSVTILFSDIVSFTKTTSNHSATEIVEALNALIQRFDDSAKKLGVEKIKTIGDAYMAACGVPSPNKRHAEIMLKFAIQMHKDFAEYNKTSRIKFRIRIGLNSGPVIAGIIGKNKFIYDIWGDTVNVASRMESNCSPGHIRMTESVVNLIKPHGYTLNLKEESIDVKGKGIMKTFEFPNR